MLVVEIESNKLEKKVNCDEVCCSVILKLDWADPIFQGLELFESFNGI